MSDRIPAWKRLGLKLKYAREDPNPDERSLFQRSRQEQQVAGNLKSHGLDLKSRPTKRRRLNHDESSQVQHSPSYINGHSQHEVSRQTDKDTRSVDNAATKPGANGHANHEPALKKRKHVSFTQDTKVGESDLRSKETIPPDTSGANATGARMVNGGGHDLNITTLSLANDNLKPRESTEPSESGTAIPHSKIKSKVNKKRKSQSLGSGRKPTAALEYLSQHHEHRDSWKFNKNRDVWILGHAQDVEAIPRSCDLALAGYVHGLPEQAASRSRLLLECKTNLESTATDISDLEILEVKKAFLDTLENVKSSTKNESLSEQILKYPRSLLLLWALGATETLTISKSRTNKKSRTSAPIEVSTSEDDSSSSSESSDDSDTVKIRNAEDSTKERKQGTKIDDPNDDTSSSGSDNGASSSDADEDTSSDSD